MKINNKIRSKVLYETSARFVATGFSNNVQMSCECTILSLETTKTHRVCFICFINHWSTCLLNMRCFEKQSTLFMISFFIFNMRLQNSLSKFLLRNFNTMEYSLWFLRFLHVLRTMIYIIFSKSVVTTQVHQVLCYNSVNL